MPAGSKIMIVEDEFILADKLVELLTANGYIALPVTDSYEEAINLLNKGLPDLALLDIKIHGEKDGIDLAGYFYRYYNIPVIFLSAYSDEKLLSRAKEAHPQTFILKSKPILNEKELLDAVKEQLLISINVALPKVPISNELKCKGVRLKVKEKCQSEGDDEDTNYEIRFISYEEITFIESYTKHEKNTVLINLMSNSFVFRDTLYNLNSILPSNFIRVHESYIVNLHKINSPSSHRLMINSRPIPIGAKYRKSVTEKLSIMGF